MRSETGLVLIVLLIVISLSSLASVHFLEQQIMMVKMLGCLKKQAKDLLVAENHLLEAEARVLKNPERFTDTVKVFVPDHLAFGCDQGQWIFRVEARPFQSFVAVRHTASSDRWFNRFKLFFTQTVVESLYTSILKPQTQWDPMHSMVLDWVRMPKVSNTVFAVSNTGSQDQALLYALDGERGSDFACKGLGRRLSQGSLAVTELFYQGHVRSVLLLMAEDAFDHRVHLWVFDLSAPHDTLREIMHQSLAIEYTLGSVFKPIAIKRTGGSWHIVLSVCKGFDGRLLFLDLETQCFSSVSVPGGALLSVTAVDQGGRGVCDALYMANAEGLWMLPLNPAAYGEIQRLLHFSIDSKIMVLPHRNQMGLELYFLGQRAGVQGLWRAVVLQRDPSKTPSIMIEVQCVVEGVFANFWVRSGRVVLMPDRMAQHPLVWDIAAQKLIVKPWKIVFSNEGQGTVLGAQLVWDPEQQQEKVIVFNSQGRMTIFATPLHMNQQGRVAFRSM